jgi:hypothetical protein
MAPTSRLHHEQPDRREKMRAMILYVAERASSAPYFGSTKLNKILFHADMEAYRRRGDSISAFEYQALINGPTLRKMKPTLRGLKNAKAIRLDRRRVIDYVEEFVVPLEEPDFGALTREEWGFVDAAIEANWAKTAGEMSDESHQMGGWVAAWRHGPKTTIPYEAVKWRGHGSPTPQQQEHAAELAKEFDLARE